MIIYFHNAGEYIMKLREMRENFSHLLMPPLCPLCYNKTHDVMTLCQTCWQDSHFITGPICNISGEPLPSGVTGDNVTLPKYKKFPPLFNKARAAVKYDDNARAIVMRLKHGDRQDLVPMMGQWMINAGADILNDSDFITPVPLHWTRYFSRLFNQSLLLGAEISKISGVEIVPDMIIRQRRTKMQKSMTYKEREKNLNKAFIMNDTYKKIVKGKNITIIDDVFTTGATVKNCTRVLKQYGANKVYVLTFAKVI